MAHIRCLNDAHGVEWSAYHGDCTEVVRQLPGRSVGFSICSIPFSSLFTYSASECDMGNNADDAEFFRHYEFLVGEWLRVTKPGRLCAVHCSDVPLQKWKDGVVGVNAFSDAVSAAHRRAGWVLHSRITIRKSPVVEMTRTKALGLLHKQLLKDSAMSRVGMPDYLLVFRSPGENREPIGHRPADFPVELWQQWAEPVWMDINQTNTLNVVQTRENADERHLCPLQLDLIERAVILWSNPGDVVLSPFMGIGSEGVVALKQRRKFCGIELADKYFRPACRHLAAAEANAPQLFNLGDAA